MSGKKFDLIKSIRGTDLYVPLVDYLNKGAKRGIELTDYQPINEYYTMAEGTTTDWTGFPISGKTMLLFNFLIEASRRHGWKHVLYTPDAGNPVEVVADLISIYTGKRFVGNYGNKITEQEIADALHFIDHFFLLVEKKDLKKRITPDAFWDFVAEMHVKDQSIKTGVIDSWKDLYHDDRDYKREDKYLEDILSYRNVLAEREGLHFHTVIHPTKPQRDNLNQIKPPTAYDLKGGSEWFNNAKNIIAVHRPSKDTNLAEVYVRKVKPRSIGKIGKFDLFFDFTTLRYYYISPSGRWFLNGKEMTDKRAIMKEGGMTIITQEPTQKENEIPF